MLRLLYRFYEPADGVIRVNGQVGAAFRDELEGGLIYFYREGCSGRHSGQSPPEPRRRSSGVFNLIYHSLVPVISIISIISIIYCYEILLEETQSATSNLNFADVRIAFFSMTRLATTSVMATYTLHKSRLRRPRRQRISTR